MWGGAFKFVHRWYGVYLSPFLSLCVCLVWPWYSYVWTNAMSLENWRKVNLFAANSVFMGAKGYTVHYLIYTYLFVSHYLLFSVHFLFVTFILFSLCFTRSSACLQAYTFRWSFGLAWTFFSRTFLLLYCIPLWFTWARERVIEVKKMTAKRFKVHFPHRFLSLTLYCEISQNQTLWLGNDYI